MGEAAGNSRFHITRADQIDPAFAAEFAPRAHTWSWPILARLTPDPLEESTKMEFVGDHSSGAIQHTFNPEGVADGWIIFRPIEREEFWPIRRTRS
mgnify:CR=1 FL=1